VTLVNSQCRLAARPVGRMWITMAFPVWVLMVSGLLLARAGLFEELRTGGDGPTEPAR
jgi:hypothetical protein